MHSLDMPNLARILALGQPCQIVTDSALTLSLLSSVSNILRQDSNWVCPMFVALHRCAQAPLAKNVPVRLVAPVHNRELLCCLPSEVMRVYESADILSVIAHLSMCAVAPPSRTARSAR